MPEKKRETLNVRIKPSLLKVLRDKAKEVDLSQSVLVEVALINLLMPPPHPDHTED